MRKIVESFRAAAGQFTTALEQLVDHLRDGIEATQVERLALLGRELRGGGLVAQRRRPPPRNALSFLAEADLCPGEFPFDEAMAVEVVGGLEREERGRPQRHRTKRFVADVEVMRI